MFVSDKFILFAIAVGLGVPRVKGIISNSYPKKSEHENGGGQRQNNEIAQSLDREYIADFEHTYKGREGLGSSDPADKHFEGGVEDYEGFKGDKYFKFGQGSHYGDGHFLHHHHYHDHFDHHKHHHYDIEYHKALAIKGLLVPLAGVALLGAAAAFISNPVLLQLGIISGAPLGRRRRDLIEQSNISFENKIRSNQIKLLENFMAKVPEEKIRTQEKKWLADYLSRIGMNNKKLCIDRIACELYSPRGKSMPIEAEVLNIVVNEILKNDFVAQKTKVEILQAIEFGKNNLSCDVFFCAELEKQTKL